jgi:hypothetical protein
MKSIAKNKDSFEESRRVWSSNGFIKYKNGCLPLTYDRLNKLITEIFFGKEASKYDTTRKTR